MNADTFEFMLMATLVGLGIANFLIWLAILEIGFLATACFSLMMAFLIIKATDYREALDETVKRRESVLRYNELSN